MNTHPFMTEVRPRFLALLAVAACQSSTDQSQGQTAGPPQSESAPVAFSPYASERTRWPLLRCAVLGSEAAEPRRIDMACHLRARRAGHGRDCRGWEACVG